MFRFSPVFARAALATLCPFIASTCAAFATNLATADGALSLADLNNPLVGSLSVLAVLFSVLNAVIGFGSAKMLSSLANRYDQELQIQEKRSKYRRRAMMDLYVEKRAKEYIKGGSRAGEVSHEELEKLLSLGMET